MTIGPKITKALIWRPKTFASRKEREREEENGKIRKSNNKQAGNQKNKYEKAGS